MKLAAVGERGRAEGQEASVSVPPGVEREQPTSEDLMRLQLAHEGMRLLLSSEVKQAERLFRKSR